MVVIRHEHVGQHVHVVSFDRSLELTQEEVRLPTWAQVPDPPIHAGGHMEHGVGRVVARKRNMGIHTLIVETGSTMRTPLRTTRP